MDLATLALTAYTLSKPFLEKLQEGTAKKIGEDIWTLIKLPFTKKGKTDIENFAIENEKEFTDTLRVELENDPILAEELEKAVQHASSIVNGNFIQNINSSGTVEKQINIQHNTGNITM